MDAQIATNGDGDYALGFTIDGAFIPLSSVPAQRVAHLVERAATLKARSDDPSLEGHEQAAEAAEGGWQVAEVKKASSSSSKAKESATDTTEGA